MNIQEYDETLRYDIRTRSNWTEDEWKDHCLEVSKKIDDHADREIVVKLINLGWNISVH